MSPSDSNSNEVIAPSAQQPQRVDPKSLLVDLESRQDELLRLLDELEERTKQALAQLGAAPVASAAPAANATTKPAARPARDAKAA